MKMRKKIAALLAAAMIASVMPMTAFAASTNRVTQIVKVANDGSTKAPQLKIELKDELKTGEIFYLNLTNAEWNKKTTDSAVDYDFVPVNDTTLGVKALKNLPEKTMITVDLNTKSIKGEATVEVDPWDTTVTAGKYVFATSSEAKAIVTVKEDDAPSFYVGTNKIAKITIEEAALGAFENAGDDNTFEVELDNDDFEFTGRYAVKYSRGFSSLTDLTVTDTKVDTQPLYGKVANRDDQTLEFKIAPSAFVNKQRGVIEIELEVKNTVRKPETGDLKAGVVGKLVEDKEYKVATIAEYGMELKSEKDYEFVAGQDETVKFHLNEIVNDSMVSGRETEFRLPEGVYFAETVAGKANVKVKDHSSVVAEPVRDKDGRIEGFTVNLTTDPAEIDKFEFEAVLDIRSTFEGDIVLEVEGRSIGEELEVKLAEVVAPVKVTVEPMKVKPGFKEQVGGKIVIEETDKARLMQGKDIVISLADKDDGMTIEAAKATVVKGDLKAKDIDVKSKDGKLTITVKRKSKEASTIEITDIEVKLNRSVPQGYYDVNVGGSAISELANKPYERDASDSAKDETYGNDNIVGKQFIIVGDPITGVKSEVKFVIGSNKFLVDGVEKEMDAAAYIKDGRTMVPLRYLATALGIDGEAIKFNAGTVTIFGGDGKVIQVAVNSKDLVINGMTIPMVAAAEIIDGRTYVPVTEIGGVFGVAGSWDAATQTATFK